jgi:predicted enzyme related to lactoylglutathione lyase
MSHDTKAEPTMPTMKLELVPVPVADVELAKAFYLQAGFTLEVDIQINPTMRVVQFTPPGSACSIVFGTGMGALTDMVPGSVKGLHLVVADIVVARDALCARGVAVSAITDNSGVYFAEFSDPAGNLWLLQEFSPAMRRPEQSFSHES